MKSNEYITLEDILTSIKNSEDSKKLKAKREDLFGALVAFGIRFISFNDLVRMLKINKFKLRLIILEFGMDDENHIDTMPKEKYNKVLNEVIDLMVKAELVELID